MIRAGELMPTAAAAVAIEITNGCFSWSNAGRCREPTMARPISYSLSWTTTEFEALPSGFLT